MNFVKKTSHFTMHKLMYEIYVKTAVKCGAETSPHFTLLYLETGLTDN